MAAVVASLGAAAGPVHLVFPDPGHPEYTQSVIHRIFDLRQEEKRAFSFSCRAKCAGMDPETPPDNSNFGMNIRVRYMDGGEKWFDPARETPQGFRLTGPGVVPSPRETGWQELTASFDPPRAVSNVTVYCRIARKGEAWFDDISVKEFPPVANRGPCSLKERKGFVLLENDSVRLAVDPAHGGAVVRLFTKADGAEHARRSPGGCLFADVFEGCGPNTGRVYEVVRRRDTPSSASVTLRTVGPDGHPFLEIEKTFAVRRDEDGVEVTRVYRNLPAAMSDVEIVPTGDAGGKRMRVPLGGTAELRRVFFGKDGGESPATAPAATSRPFRLELSDELVTPHTPWLKPYAGGTTRALFVLDIRQQREIIELAERMDLDARTVRIAQVREYMSWGMIDGYGTYTFSDANRAIASELESGAFDVIVVAGRLWERIDDANRAKISAMLGSGTGLVAVENPALVPDGYAEHPKGVEYVKGGMPDELLPFGASRVKTFAKGRSRAVLLEYRAFDGLTPFVQYNAREPGFFYADYTLGMVAKALLWAARKDMPVPPGAKAEESEEDSGEGLLITRRIFSADGRKCGFECSVRHGESSAAAKARVAERDRELEYPAEPPPWPDFPFSVGESCHRNGIKRYLVPLRYSQLLKLGVNQIRFWAIDPPEYFRPYLKYGLGFDFPVAGGGQLAWNRFRDEFGEPFAKTGDKKYLVRKPCLNDPEFLTNDFAQVAAKIDRLSCLKPVVYDCGDENSLTRWSAEFDFCFGEHCLAAFREWLKGEYTTLEGLNAEWGTDFARWDDVVPDTTPEARARASRTGRRAYGAWADHRRFMEITYAKYFDGVHRTIASKAPHARYDMSGTQPPNGWTGMDMWLIGKVVDLPALYDVENLGEIIRSFHRPFAHPWFGYRMGSEQGRWRAWNDAFRYLDFGISFYHEGLMLMPDYTVPEPVAALTEALEDLRAGGARLLRSLEGEEEAFIHYSQASVHAAQIEGRYADFVAARDMWIKRLVAAGVQFRFMSYEELENGILDRTAAKAVVLPQSAALSQAEVDALLRFAARGGRVVGDAQSGRMNRHCRELPANPLAGVVVGDHGFGKGCADGVRMFRFHSRSGLNGRYWGFTREVGSAPGAASRTVSLGKPMFVYDMRGKRRLGRRDSFKVALSSGEAAFYAVLPYEVKALHADGNCALRLEVLGGEAGFHPVMVRIFDSSGKLVGTDMTETVRGVGEWRPHLPRGAAPGRYQVVFTDFVSGCTASRTLSP